MIWMEQKSRLLTSSFSVIFKRFLRGTVCMSQVTQGKIVTDLRVQELTVMYMYRAVMLYRNKRLDHGKFSNRYLQPNVNEMYGCDDEPVQGHGGSVPADSGRGTRWTRCQQITVLTCCQTAIHTCRPLFQFTSSAQVKISKFNRQATVKRMFILFLKAIVGTTEPQCHLTFHPSDLKSGKIMRFFFFFNRTSLDRHGSVMQSWEDGSATCKTFCNCIELSPIEYK